MSSVIELADVALSDRAARFGGKDHGAQVSFFVTTHERGEGAALFTIDEKTVEAHADQIVVVPAGAAHASTGASDLPLKLVSIHPAPAMETEWLE